MDRVVGQPSEGTSEPTKAKEPDRLPLRWAIIISISAAVGILTGNLAAGIGAGLAAVAVLHIVIA
ncbi:hypothetical protein [Nonomuraea angiospora]